MFAGRKFAALLFDMDGTVVNSIAAAERVWADWARRQDLDVSAFLPTIHGVRAIETIARLALPGVDPMREADALLQAEVADIDGILPIAGAAAFLASLPPERWAIVTSAPRELALLRIVFEDAPAGIAAAEAAGAAVVVISATHQHPLQTPHAAIAGYDGIGVTVDDRGWIVLGAERAAA
ncbi:MAG: HAD family hydrolase [Mesorhizobium sp.]|nr:MAG: HAD family hydrolase [Mesorhizobium sp.]